VAARCEFPGRAALVCPLKKKPARGPSVLTVHGFPCRPRYTKDRGSLCRTSNKSCAGVCVVGHIERHQSDHPQVGVEFTLPNPMFWHVAFPPKDWMACHPDAKSRVNGRIKPKSCARRQIFKTMNLRVRLRCGPMNLLGHYFWPEITVRDMLQVCVFWAALGGR